MRKYILGMFGINQTDLWIHLSAYVPYSLGAGKEARKGTGRLKISYYKEPQHRCWSFFLLHYPWPTAGGTTSFSLPLKQGYNCHDASIQFTELTSTCLRGLSVAKLSKRIHLEYLSKYTFYYKMYVFMLLCSLHGA